MRPQHVRGQSAFNDALPTKIEDGLYLGNAIHGTSADILRSLNIKCVLNATKRRSPLLAHSLRFVDPKGRDEHINEGLKVFLF